MEYLSSDIAALAIVKGRKMGLLASTGGLRKAL